MKTSNCSRNALLLGSNFEIRYHHSSRHWVILEYLLDQPNSILWAAFFKKIIRDDPLDVSY